MKCRKCSAEIAEKAIVCYRCGTPTADLPEVSRSSSAPAGRTWQSVLIWVVLVIVALAVYWFAVMWQPQ